jgi:lysophospholipase L1-like esterase
VTGWASEPQQDILPAGSTVIALGDSLTYGYGASPETAYPTVLADLSKWRVINAGVNGDTSSDVLARVEKITKQNPNLVLLGVGGNDVLQRIQSDTTRANITAIIDTLQAKNIDVILVAEPHLSASALFGKVSDNPLYEDIADAKDIPLYSSGWSAVLSDDTLKSDQIHANAAGYRQFAEGLHGYLQEEGWVY